MKSILHTTQNPKTGRYLLFTMAFFLVLSGLLAPVMPIVDAATITNANEAAKLQQLVPLDPEDSDNEGEEQPVDPGDTPDNDVPDGDTPDGDDAPDNELNGLQEEEEPTGPASLAVNLHWCPVDINIAGAPDGESLKNPCQNSGPEVFLGLSSASGNYPQQQQVATTFPGTASFGNLEPDVWRLDIRSVPQTVEALFCEGYLVVDGNIQSNTKPYAQAFRSQTATPAFEFETVHNESITCDWFVQMPHTGILGLTKWNCPEGFDFASATYNAAREACTDPVDGPVGFEVANNQGTNTYLVQQDTQPASLNSVLFADVPTGTTKVSEKVPEGYELAGVFCSLIDWNTPSNSSQQPQAQTIVDGNTWEYNSSAFSLTSCDVFNIPPGEDDGADHDDANTPDEGYGDVLVFKWECTVEVPMDANYTWYSQNCQQAMHGVTFVLSLPDLELQTDTGDSIPGAVMMGGQQAGAYPLTETVPAGYAPLAVYCATISPNGQPSADQFMQYPLAGSSITAEITADMVFYCDWFNGPDTDHDGISVTIYKWECPVGTSYDQEHSYYFPAGCETEMANVPFEITDDTGTQSTTSDTNGRQIDGLLGEITITEVIPDGYGSPVVFCRLLNDDNSTAMAVSMGSIILQPADDDYQCDWFNIPMPHNSVHIQKYECPEGTMTDATVQWLGENCTTPMGDVDFTLKHSGGTTELTTDALGQTGYSPVPPGQIVITEHVPAGYSKYPLLVCGFNAYQEGQMYDGFLTKADPIGSTWSFDFNLDNTRLFCYWYNIPEPESTVTIYKWRCPDGMPAEHSTSWFTTNCTTPMQVDFTLTDGKGPRMLTATGGVAQWTDVATGAVQITEHIPTGYAQQPFLVCYVIGPTGIASDTFNPTTVNGTWNTTIDAAGSEIICNWYNWYLGPGDITVYKWTCPEGYNKHAWGADPMVDCTVATNGITFMLDQPDPEVDLYSDTGDSINGAVYFGGLTPGDYTISEMVGPGEFQDVFIWQCYGLNSSSVHPTPLNVGQHFNFKIVGGDNIICHWFNVPYPQYGYMVVTKFNCSTEKYVSDVYCYTNQTGQYFDLQRWNGSTWTTVQSGTTDVSGKVTFNNLEGGDYRLIEPNKQACLMKSSNITPGGNIGVNTGEGTTVHVYNCKTPPPPQKTPTKYPNTGVGPAAESDSVRTPGVALTGLLGLLGLAMNRRRMVAGAGLVTAGTAATALPLLNAQELLPLDSTPAPGTPSPDDFWCATPTAATPDANDAADAASTPTFDPCNRGPVPIQMRIPEIGVDAPIEYLEIIDGLMQQPTGDTHVTWYKETSRLGEVGNGIYAAHVNWYGNPEGIFFRLESLQEGDVIEIDGDNLQTYLFEVLWTQDFPSDEEPPDEALGLTDEVSITLITCGGEWSSALSEYDHRTLVRAVMRA